MASQKEKDVSEYYKNFLVSNVKNRKNLTKEVLYNLYKKPVKDSEENTPHIQPAEKNATHQADILYLPNDDGYKYGLTVVDVGSRLMDCEPLKSKDSKATLAAIQKIYKRKILSMPTYSIEVDAGTEFKGEFKQFFEKKGIDVRVAEAGRHRQQALVESRNGSIARPLLQRQTAEELLTGEPSVEWVQYLPTVVKFLNERFERKAEKTDDKNPDYNEIFKDTRCKGQACKLLDVGSKVRYQLDEPRDVLTDKKLHGNRFRAGDIRLSMKVTEVERYQLIPGQVPLYKIKGRTALYTKNQLQVVDEKANLPPASVQEKFIIEKLLDKKKVKGKVYFLVKWKGYDKETLEPRTTLIKDVPSLVKKYEDDEK